MSNHFSAANLQHPGDDARLDLTDLFVFAAPDNPDRTVLIMDSNPFTKGDGFHPDAVYRFNIDNDGDALADVAFSVTFSEFKDGRQPPPPTTRPAARPRRVNHAVTCSSKTPRRALMPRLCPSRERPTVCVSDCGGCRGVGIRPSK